MDIFCEYIVKHKKGIKDYLAALGCCLAACVLTLLFTVYSKYLFGFALFLIVMAWWGAVYLIKARNVEYEYILTNSEMDIDRIVARRKRKRMLTVNFRLIDICARVDDPEFKSVYENTANFAKIYDFSGDGASSAVYFVDFQNDSGRIRVLFQPNDKIKESLPIFNPRVIHI